MKYLVFIFFLLNFNLYGQYRIKDALLPFAFSFISGTSNGLNQTINHHYSRFKHRFPNANDKYWNPDMSWCNKYKSCDKSKGEAFFTSTTFLVWTTDANHLTNTISRHSLFASGLIIGLNKEHRKKWWQYGVDVGLSFIAYTAGFHLTYNVLLK